MNSLYFGVVEDRISDPLELGRCKVRVVGVHTEDKLALPTEDLPWAYPMTPITSASMNGIGEAPVGTVEGSWVVVMFRDDAKQQPVILGSVGGIPEQSPKIKVVRTSIKGAGGIKEQKNVLTTADGSTVTDSNGQPIQVGPQEPGQEAASSEDSTGLAMSLPKSMTLSARGRNFIMKEEGLSSSTKGKNRLLSSSADASTTVYSYDDGAGNWTIGYGSTYLKDGSKVTESTTLTKGECDALMEEKLRVEFVPAVQRAIKSPVTQSMFDAMVAMAYNMGGGGFRRSQVVSNINRSDYAAAAASIKTTSTLAGAISLTKRRAAEYSLFIMDGLPGIEPGSRQAEPTPSEIPPVAEGEPYQIREELIIESGDGDGFSDPFKVYPKQDWLNEPDTHRLARHKSLEKTIVQRKDASRETGVECAHSSSWNQAPIPYNAKYPYNQVRATESGHVIELDDTPGNERLAEWHKAGTYREVDVNGTVTNRIVGESFEIVECNSHVLIKGSCFITVNGDAKILAKNDVDLEVRGDLRSSVGGNHTHRVRGNMTTTVEGSHSLVVSGSNLIKSGGVTAADGSQIHLNGGLASSLSPTGNSAGEASGQPSIPTLTVPGRSSELDANYETPEEGFDPALVETAIASGAITEAPEALPTAAPISETTPEDKPTMPDNVSSCGILDSDLTPTLKLSQRYTLKDLSVGQSGAPAKGSVHYGRKATEIVCNMQKLCANVLDVIKAEYPNATLTSVWRSEAVNTAVKGSKTSDHLKGCAADVVLSGFSREQHYNAIVAIQKILPKYRQLILEYKGSSTWIHVSYVEGDNKRQNLTIDAAVNKTINSNGFTLR